MKGSGLYWIAASIMLGNACEYSSVMMAITAIYLIIVATFYIFKD